MYERILSLIKAFDGFPLFAKWQEIISLCKEGILKEEVTFESKHLKVKYYFQSKKYPAHT